MIAQLAHYEENHSKIESINFLRLKGMPYGMLCCSCKVARISIHYCAAVLDTYQSGTVKQKYIYEKVI